MTCDEAKPFLRNAKLPQIVERHVHECESCRKIVHAERAFRDAYAQTVGELPRRERSGVSWPISRLWVNVVAFILGIAIPVVMVVGFRSPRELGGEVLLAHTLLVKGKVQPSPAADLSELGRKTGVDVSPSGIEGARLHRLGSVPALHLSVSRDGERVSILVFPRSKLESFAESDQELRTVRTLSRSVNEYRMVVKVGDQRVAIAIGKISESAAHELLASY